MMGGVRAGLCLLVLLAFASSGHGALVVLPGSSRVAWLPNAKVKLKAKLVGATSAELESVAWSIEHGPDDVTWVRQTKLTPKLTFTTRGPYIVKVVVRAKGERAEGRLVVEVYNPEQNFGGYTDDFLRTHFTGDLKLKYDFTDFEFGNFKNSCPEVGTHPRVFICPGEDTARVKASLRKPNDEGVYLFDKIKTQLNSFKKTASWLDAAAEADKYPNHDLSNVEIADDTFALLVMYEVFVTYVEDDWKNGRRAAKVVSMMCQKILNPLRNSKRRLYDKSYAKYYDQIPNRRQEIRSDYRDGLQGIMHRKALAMAYDLGHKFMTEVQRRHCRKMLIEASSDVWTIGMDFLPSLQGMRSNWISTVTDLLIISLSVEGEEVPNAGMKWDYQVYARALAAYERFVAVGFDADGSSYEGLGKNSLIAATLVPLARRDNYLIATENVKNHVKRNYLYNMLPWGGNNAPGDFRWRTFTFDEVLGGMAQSRYADVPAVWWAYPEDKQIRMVARAEMQDGFGRLSDFNVRAWFHGMDFIHRALFLQEIPRTPGWFQMYSQDNQGEPLSYFADFQGRAVMLSKWSPTALMMIFQPRHHRGGHSQRDRNKFCLYGLRKTWIECTGSTFTTNLRHSLVTIDNDLWRPTFLAAKTVAQYDTSLASFFAGDAKSSYATTAGLGKVQGEIAEFTPFTVNSHRYRPNYPQGDLIKRNLPNWEDGMRPYRNNTSSRYKTTEDSVGRFPVKAFRTAGIVRGDFPYGLVIDDIQESETEEHIYTWQAVILRYMTQDPTVRDENTVYDEATASVTFTDTENPQMKFLIRFVDSSEVPQLTWAQNFASTLQMKVTAVVPDFKVLLYTYEEGDPLPVTTYEKAKNKLTVQLPGQRDVFKFFKDEYGRNRFILKRNPGTDSQEVFNFKMKKILSKTGGEIVIPDKESVLDNFDNSANDYTALWQNEWCINKDQDVCKWPFYGTAEEF